MNRVRVVASSTQPARRTAAATHRSQRNAPRSGGSRIDRILFLQRALGNQAVKTLLESRSALGGTGRKKVARRNKTVQRAPASKSFRCPDFAGDKKLEACLNDRDRLRPGEKGPSVEKVQRALLNDGIFIGPEGADAKFGANTAQGVIDFKTKHGLGSTSFPDVGPGTMGKLDELCGSGLPPLPACKFIVRYGNERRGSECGPPGCLCQPGSCGGGIQFDILDIKASGAACPRSLAGLPVTEQVTIDAGCLAVPPPITGSFTLDSNGKVPVTGATDTYRLCFPRKKMDMGVMVIVRECTQTATQKVFVGGMLADTRTIKFKVLFQPDLSAPDFVSCDAIVTRS